MAPRRCGIHSNLSLSCRKLAFFVSKTLVAYADLCLRTYAACGMRMQIVDFLILYFPKIYFCSLKVIFSILTYLKSI